VPVMAAVVVIVVVVFALTPAGTAFANMLQHFFKPVEVEQLPKPDGYRTETPAPTQEATLVSANEVVPTITPTLAPTDEPTPSPLDICYEDLYGYECQIARAEMKVGFDAKEFPGRLKNFRFKAVEKPENNQIMMRYDLIGGGGYLFFSQGIGTISSFSGGAVPEDSIQEVMVGENRGEFVQGMFGATAQDATYQWMDCCRHRLRWMDGERWFEINAEVAQGPNFPYQQADYLIELALSLVDEPVENDEIHLDYITSIEDLEKVAPFDFLEPSILPENYVFDYGRVGNLSYHHGYDDEIDRSISISYASSSPTGVIESVTELFIYQLPAEDVDFEVQLQGKTVDINGFEGIHSVESPFKHWIIWQTDEIYVSFRLNSSPVFLTEEQVLEIARGLE